MTAFTTFTIYNFYKPLQSPQVPAFDFVAWMSMCLQVLQVPPKSQVPAFDFVAWMCLQVL